MRRSLLVLLAALVLLDLVGAAFVTVRVVGAEGPVAAGVVPTGQLGTTSTTQPTTAPTSAPPATPAPDTLTWTTCADHECAKLPVPLDYAQPTGRQIGIALIRERATDRAHRIGSVLVNPGGPGVSGVKSFPDLLGRLSDDVRARFDVIGFDPRGTGDSAPVHCLPTAQLAAYFAVDPTPDDPAEKAALIQASQRFVAGCQQRSGELLPHVGTQDAARDMDRIRAAVGDQKLTYVGFSYGTSLGASYAAQFPDRVRALVLDGAVDPVLDTMGLNRAQGEGFDRAFDNFAADCRAKGSACAWQPAGGATKQAFLALSSRIDGHPVPAGTQRVGPSEFFIGTAAFLYSQSTWPLLAQALSQLESGSGTVALAGFDALIGRNPDGTFSNEQEANAAINCLDNPAPKDVAAYEQAAAAAARTAPAYGPAIAWSGLTCGMWPVPPVPKPQPQKTPGSAPILVVGTTNDPATPFAWAQALAAQLPLGRLLRHNGEGHTAYGEDDCTTRVGDAYLLTLTLPAGDITC